MRSFLFSRGFAASGVEVVLGLVFAGYVTLPAGRLPYN